MYTAWGHKWELQVCFVPGTPRFDLPALTITLCVSLWGEGHTLHQGLDGVWDSLILKDESWGGCGEQLHRGNHSLASWVVFWLCSRSDTGWWCITMVSMVCLPPPILLLLGCVPGSQYISWGTAEGGHLLQSEQVWWAVPGTVNTQHTPPPPHPAHTQKENLGREEPGEAGGGPEPCGPGWYLLSKPKRSRLKSSTLECSVPTTLGSWLY